MRVHARNRWALQIVLLVAAAAGCDHRRPTGNLSLTVTVPSDTPVTEVDYELTGVGLPGTKGGIRAPEPSTSFSRLISHVPTGDDYLVHATAKSVDGKMECDGTGNTEVRANATTVLTIALTCQDAGGGHIQIAIGVVCPWFQVTSYTVSPLSASVGQQIAVSETTSSADGAPISFQWTAPTGTFDSPTDSATMYTCVEPGAVTLTAGASTGPCQAAQMIVVHCVGDGGVDAEGD